MAATAHQVSGGKRSRSRPTRPTLLRLSAAIHPSCSPRHYFSSLAAAYPNLVRRIGIAVDLSDESAYAVKWTVRNYLRRSTDAVVLLHVRPIPVLYGADWGSNPPVYLVDDEEPDAAAGEDSRRKREEDWDALTTDKARYLARPLVAARVPFRIHIVEDCDMKERLCIEAERMGLSAMIMGTRGFGASGEGKGRLGSVSDYCVHHCVCPVVVVRYPGNYAAIPPMGLLPVP